MSPKQYVVEKDGVLIEMPPLGSIPGTKDLISMIIRKYFLDCPELNPALLQCIEFDVSFKPIFNSAPDTAGSSLPHIEFAASVFLAGSNPDTALGYGDFISNSTYSFEIVLVGVYGQSYFNIMVSCDQDPSMLSKNMLKSTMLQAAAID